MTLEDFFEDSETSEPGSVAAYLESLSDDDAKRIAAVSRDDWGRCPLASNCGLDMKRAIDACVALMKELDNTFPVALDRSRSKIWNAVGQHCHALFAD